jgi:two-component system response regulator AtoC
MTDAAHTDQRGDDGQASLRHHLLVINAEGALPVLLPEEGVLTIGRDDDADIGVNDPRASRHHARLHIGARFELEDLGSANGTRVREQRLQPRASAPLEPGDPVAIGDTVLSVERREPGFEARRVWAHGYLETRLIEECARAQSRAGRLALLRLHTHEHAPVAAVERVLIGALRPGDLLAAYSPHEYEVLVPEADEAAARALADGLVAALGAQKIGARAALAVCPADGTSPQRLITMACERLRGNAAAGPTAVVVESRAARELYAVVRRVAVGSSNVLLVGEAGSGKELLADGIHRLSPRGDRALLALNCAAFNEKQLELELFGCERGALEGLPDGKIGVLEAAAGGTVFLDDVAEMPALIQLKLLHALETKQVLRVGAPKPRPLDARFVASSFHDLAADVADKRFRQDLFEHLDFISLEIPPLRERTEEIGSLARLFLKRLTPAGRSPPALSPDALALMRAYSWPGNVRELRNVIERAALLCTAGTIMEVHLPAARMRRSAWPVVPSPITAPITATAAAAPARDAKSLERQAIIDALRRCHGNPTRAAELMGMPRRVFVDLMLEHKLARPRTPNPSA